MKNDRAELLWQWSNKLIKDIIVEQKQEIFYFHIFLCRLSATKRLLEMFSWHFLHLNSLQFDMKIISTSIQFHFLSFPGTQTAMDAEKEGLPPMQSESNSHVIDLNSRRKVLMSQQSTVASRRQQAVCVRRAHKIYGTKKNPHVILDGLNMTVPKGTMWVVTFYCNSSLLTLESWWITWWLKVVKSSRLSN